MQTGFRLPCPEADAGDELSLGPRGMQRHAAAVATEDKTGFGEPAQRYLQTLHRRIDVTGRSPASGFFAQNMPRLDGLPQLDLHAAVSDLADNGKAKFKMGGEPVGLQRIARIGQLRQNFVKVLGNKVWQHPAVMQRSPPPDERLVIRG